MRSGCRDAPNCRQDAKCLRPSTAWAAAASGLLDERTRGFDVLVAESLGKPLTSPASALPLRGVFGSPSLQRGDHAVESLCVFRVGPRKRWHTAQ